MYCINVCNIPCPKTGSTELLRIISQRFSRKLPIRNVKIPARKNRYPANRIWLPAPSIASHSYPIFTHGKALPHNAQQSRARANTTPGFCNFFSIYNVISFHFYQFLSITHFYRRKKWSCRIDFHQYDNSYIHPKCISKYKTALLNIAFYYLSTTPSPARRTLLRKSRLSLFSLPEAPVACHCSLWLCLQFYSQHPFPL